MQTPHINRKVGARHRFRCSLSAAAVYAFAIFAFGDRDRTKPPCGIEHRLKARWDAVSKLFQRTALGRAGL
jgi:hypothetical protein